MIYRRYLGCFAYAKKSFFVGDLEPSDCPVGFFCVRGTPRPEPCQPGTFGEIPSLNAQLECSQCTPGKLLIP